MDPDRKSQIGDKTHGPNSNTYVIKDAGFRSMRVKFKEENSLYSVKIVATFRWPWVCQPHQALLN